MKAKRILVIGCPGAGKSTLSLELAELSGLPLIHLDKEYWKKDWQEPAKEEWHKKVDELISADKWILDGNYGGTMERRLARADAVIFLDYPRLVCLWSALKRQIQFHGKTRPDMGPECEETLDFVFLKYVWGFKKQERRKICKLLEKVKVPVITLKNRAEADEFLDKLEEANKR